MIKQSDFFKSKQTKINEIMQAIEKLGDLINYIIINNIKIDTKFFSELNNNKEKIKKDIYYVQDSLSEEQKLIIKKTFEDLDQVIATYKANNYNNLDKLSNVLRLKLRFYAANLKELVEQDFDTLDRDLSQLKDFTYNEDLRNFMMQYDIPIIGPAELQMIHKKIDGANVHRILGWIQVYYGNLNLLHTMLDPSSKIKPDFIAQYSAEIIEKLHDYGYYLQSILVGNPFKEVFNKWQEQQEATK